MTQFFVLLSKTQVVFFHTDEKLVGTTRDIVNFSWLGDPNQNVFELQALRWDLYLASVEVKGFGAELSVFSTEEEYDMAVLFTFWLPFDETLQWWMTSQIFAETIRLWCDPIFDVDRTLSLFAKFQHALVAGFYAVKAARDSNAPGLRWKGPHLNATPIKNSTRWAKPGKRFQSPIEFGTGEPTRQRNSRISIVSETHSTNPIPTGDFPFLASACQPQFVKVCKWKTPTASPMSLAPDVARFQRIVNDESQRAQATSPSTYTEFRPDVGRQLLEKMLESEGKTLSPAPEIGRNFYQIVDRQEKEHNVGPISKWMYSRELTLFPFLVAPRNVRANSHLWIVRSDSRRWRLDDDTIDVCSRITLEDRAKMDATVGSFEINKEQTQNIDADGDGDALSEKLELWSTLENMANDTHVESCTPEMKLSKGPGFEVDHQFENPLFGEIAEVGVCDCKSPSCPVELLARELKNVRQAIAEKNVKPRDSDRRSS